MRRKEYAHVFSDKKRIFALIFCVLLGIFSVFLQPVHALGNVRIVSSSSYYDSLNVLWVVGEVENNGDMATRFTKVSATFYDSSNQFVAADYGYSDVDVLLPNTKSPFEILLLQSESSLNVYNYTLAVSWDNYAAGKPLGIQILSDSSYVDGIGYKHVIGQVKNVGTVNANFTQVIVTFYDESGIVVGADFDYTEPTHLAPNQIGSFDVSLNAQQSLKVASYSLTAESTQYAFEPTSSPSPTPTASPSPTPSPTPAPTPTSSPTPTPTPSPSPTPSPTSTPNTNPTSAPTSSPTPTQAEVPIPTPSPTLIPFPSLTPTPTPKIPEFPESIFVLTLFMAIALTFLFFRKKVAKTH